MSPRRLDPRAGELEGALRRALLAAAESIEPRADGLDRIRVKVAAGRHRVPHRSYLTVFARVGRTPLRLLATAMAGLWSILDLVVERFRPNPDGPGRYGWLRPAAALATGLFVVVAGSWAVTDLPQVIAPTANSGGGPATIGVGTPRATSTASPSGRGAVGPGPGRRSRPVSSPSCSSRGVASHAPTSSPSSTPSSTASASPSPTITPTVSPSPTITPTTSPSPTITPTDSTSTQASPESTPGSTAATSADESARGTGSRHSQGKAGEHHLLAPMLTVSPSPTISPSPRSTPPPCT
jgi:hypothetical protein